MILFTLNASYTHYSYALVCLKNALEENGLPCTVYESNINERDDDIFYNLYRFAQTDGTVGFACYIWNIEKILAITEQLKHLLPDTTVIYGGPEVSYEFEKPPFVDYIISGEGEGKLVELYRNLLDKTGGLPETHRNTGTGGSHLLYYESTRGCPYSCTYCISGIESGRVRRIRDADEVIDDMSRINAGKTVKFCDRTFNYDIKRANAIFEGLPKNNGIKYHFEMCPALFDKDTFRILADIPPGIFQFEIGIQSLNMKTLNAVNRKMTDLPLIMDNLQRLKECGGIHLHLDLIAGLPYESFGSFLTGIDKLYKYSDFIQIGFLKLLKGTVIRKNAEQYGYIYKTKPPYTVIANDFISYEELYLLSRLEKVYRKYTGEAFISTTNWLYKGSIVEPLMKVVKYLDDNNIHLHKLSQRAAYQAYYDAFKDETGIDNGILKDKLTEDFQRYENKKICINTKDE